MPPVHQKGIIHRDMKPANIVFAVEPDGHVIPKILDFGIAKLPAAGSALTMDGSVLGTPHYMSPEQIRGQEDIDGRSDMFSFAVLL
jgi:eukaryotic-like serine/threonine-protein kinase